MKISTQSTTKVHTDSISHLTEKGQRDFRLIKMALETNDQKAYGELVSNYRNSIYYMMLKMTSNPTDAEDLTFEAFGRAFKNLDKYDGNNAFSTWLFKIATNNCVDFMRKKNRVLQVVVRGNEELNTYLTNKVPSSTLNPEEAFIKDQNVDLMRSIVRRLKPHYQKIVELRYFKEYSYEEIMSELALPLGTVKTQLFRARETMYDIMKDSRENLVSAN